MTYEQAPEVEDEGNDDLDDYLALLGEDLQDPIVQKRLEEIRSQLAANSDILHLPPEVVSPEAPSTEE